MAEQEQIKKQDGCSRQNTYGGQNACVHKEKVLQFLAGTLPEQEMKTVESHIENCPMCSAMVDGYLTKEQEIVIPRQVYQGAQDKLKEQAVHYEKGARRIVIFTIVGMIMGWFSKIYVYQEFFLIKLILGIPYKISEFIYRTFGNWGSHANFSETMIEYWGISGMEIFGIFPFDQITGFLAEFVTPVLIGGMIYGSLAYFTGDKRIFTLTKYLKFAGAWVVVLALYVGSMFGIYHLHMDNMNSLKGVQGFEIKTQWGYLYCGETEQEEQTIRLIPSATDHGGQDDSQTEDGIQTEDDSQTEDDVQAEDGGQTEDDSLQLTWQEAQAELSAGWMEAFDAAQAGWEKIEMGTLSGEMTAEEQLITLRFAVDELPCRINTRKKYLRTFGGEIYRITDEFAALIEKYGVKEAEDYAENLD